MTIDDPTKPLPHTRDVEYAARIVSGDVEALRAVMEAYGERLARVATIITGSPELAKEAVQDAFVQLWESRKTFDPTPGVIGYLIMVTRRRALNLVRHERKHDRLEHLIVQSRDTAIDPATRNRGEETLEVSDLKRCLHVALHELPPRCREIFLLNRQAGLSYAEIEQLLGISNASIRNQMARAVRHLGLAVGAWRDL